MSTLLQALPPLLSTQTRVLILGSFPGIASLKAQQYYGHPQNQFWKILQTVWPDGAPQQHAQSYAARCDWMLSKGLGLWDVYASCEREGSLDSNIRHAQLNDFAALARHCPDLQAVAHNGAESFKHAKYVQQVMASPMQDKPALEFCRLPSTSPANAAWRFERKLQVWRDLFVQHGLVKP
ncbi:G/U mismatch-specific DNA glycosylase [Polaromonas vacuolata]|uniref:G/U mismatch-specific DNA glycosylase n=1 Tax=Polaromonas vacuolata TaxID=37448 RepID=A0A6H2H6E4_9BURK|nr:DNA-deoxyinosine glycosylase [Polaromonas vacuolata]QJC55337.1 G/U mismatch-specific DNA glycosylase [Polaromonas vacuolata]